MQLICSKLSLLLSKLRWSYPWPLHSLNNSTVKLVTDAGVVLLGAVQGEQAELGA